MNTLISIIATLISSVAPAGVAVSLLLQARQLRASQLQALRELHTELIKMGMDHPILRSTLESDIGPEELSQAAVSLQAGGCSKENTRAPGGLILVIPTELRRYKA
jgi:Family of unknown function (DUF6082)